MAAPILTPVHCDPCGAIFKLPEISAEKRNRIVEFVRLSHPAEAVRVLTVPRQIELTDAKRIVDHITRKPGICHRCRKALPNGGQVVCSNCKSLNFDW